MDPAPARHELREILHRERWGGDVDGVVLAVQEALVNAQRHAGGVKEATARVSNKKVVVEIVDQGPGFDLPASRPEPPDPFAEQGRGLWLIRQLATSSDVDRKEGTTRVRLNFESDPSPPG